MQEALTLFDSICNSRWFIKTSIILFLNKIDLFAQKLPISPMGEYFPDYTGGANYDAACDYLLHRFVSLNQSAASKQIYAHYTCATDTQQIKCKSVSRRFTGWELTFLPFPSRLERHSGHPAPDSSPRVWSPITPFPVIPITNPFLSHTHLIPVFLIHLWWAIGLLLTWKERLFVAAVHPYTSIFSSFIHALSNFLCVICLPALLLIV